MAVEFANVAHIIEF